MITKFDTYNESRLFKQPSDGEVKIMIDKIKNNFDVSKLECKIDAGHNNFKYEYNGILVHKKFSPGREWGGGTYYYHLFINGDEIKNVSEYVIKKLFKFFDKENDKRNIEKEKIKIRTKTDLEDASELGIF